MENVSENQVEETVIELTEEQLLEKLNASKKERETKCLEEFKEFVETIVVKKYNCELKSFPVVLIEGQPITLHISAK